MGIILISLDGFSCWCLAQFIASILSENIRNHSVVSFEHQKTRLIKHCQKYDRALFQWFKKDFWWDNLRWKLANHEPNDAIEVVLKALILISWVDFFESFRNEFNILKQKFLVDVTFDICSNLANLKWFSNYCRLSMTVSMTDQSGSQLKCRQSENEPKWIRIVFE